MKKLIIATMATLVVASVSAQEHINSHNFCSSTPETIILEVDPAITKAAETNDADRIARELARGLNPNSTTYEGFSLLDEAIVNHSDKVFDLLVKAGADVNQLFMGEGPMRLARDSANKYAIKILSEKGSKPSGQDVAFEKVLDLERKTGDHLIDAIRKQDTGELTLFVSSMYDINDALILTGANGGYTALHEVAAQGKADSIKFLAGCGANLNARTAQGKAVISYAPDDETRHLLISLGAADESRHADDVDAGVHAKAFASLHAVLLLIDELNNGALNRDYQRQWLSATIDHYDSAHLLVTEKDADDFLDRNSAAFGRTQADTDQTLGELQALIKRQSLLTSSQLPTWLSAPQKFSPGEWFHIDAPRPKDEAERRRRWQLRIGADSLTYLQKNQTPAQIATTLDHAYGRELRSATKINEKAPYGVAINVLLSLVDQHDEYYPPHEPGKLELVGIGAVLKEQNGGIIIVRCVKGGPAEKSGQIADGDELLAVAEGSGEFVPVDRLSVDDAVELVRGQAGSSLRLRLRHLSSLRDVDLVRAKVELPDLAASYSIQSVQRGGKSLRIAVVKVPEFYTDYKDPSDHSLHADILKMLNTMGRIDGLILDLRNNGGGALMESSETAGLFLGRNHVLQISNGRRAETMVSGQDKIYGGPLLVLVNGLSAGASEILASAVQDYHRGLVVGQPTFGLASVKSLRILPQGALSLVEAVYYRVSGLSFGGNGVRPDIILPFLEASVQDSGNKEAPYLGAPEHLAAINVEAAPVINIAPLQRVSEKRLAADAFVSQWKDVLNARRAAKALAGSLDAVAVAAATHHLESAEAAWETQAKSDLGLQESLDIMGDWVAGTINSPAMTSGL